MAGVTYHGEFPEGADAIEQHGYEFSRDGKAVNVTEKDLLAKFAGNRFFKTADSEKEDVEQGQDEAEKAEVETLREYLKRENVPVHHRTGLDGLRKAKADHEKAQQKASED